MYWVGYSILSGLVGTFKNITTKEGLLHTFESSFALYMSLVSTIISLIYNIIYKVPFNINGNAIIAGIFLAIGILLIMNAINKADNPGLPIAFYRTQCILTTILMSILFNSKLSYYKILFMCIVIAGSYILAKSLHAEHHKSIQNTHSYVDNRIKNIVPVQNWIILSILSGIFVSGKDVFTKYALVSKNSNMFNFIFYILLVQTILFVIYEYYISGKIELLQKNTQIIANTKDVVYTIITGILFYLYNYTLTVACKIAPNIGYVKSIDCLGIVATVILSNIIFGTKLNIESYIGIGVTILGVIGVSI